MKTYLTIALIAFAAILANAQTNTPLAFTNVTIEAYTGWQYQGNGGANTALLGASVDIGSFSAGKLGVLDYGLGAESAIGNTGSAVQTASLRVYLIKNMDTVQIYGFGGEGRNFNDANYYTEFGVGVNYNLYRGANWCSYIGSGISFRAINTAQMDYLPFVRTGIAF